MGKADSLPFIPNEIEQKRGRPLERYFFVEIRSRKGKRPDACKGHHFFGASSKAFYELGSV